MPIKAVLDSLESVDESMKSLYREVGDGRYILDVEGMVAEDDIETHEKTQGLKSALDKERQARRDFEKKLKEAENKNSEVSADDLKELADLRDIKRQAEEERRRREGEFDKWREEIATEHKSDVEARDTLIKSLQNQIREDRIGRQIVEACAEHGAPPALMQAYIEKHVQSKFTDEGSLDVTVVDADGTRIVDNEGKPLGISGFVKKLADSKDFGQYFASKQKSGTGNNPGDRDGPGGEKTGEKPSSGNVDLESMSASQRATHEKKQKIARFRAEQEAGNDE